MSVQTYAQGPNFFTMMVAAPGASTLITGLSNLNITWRRPLLKVKELDNSAPKLLYGKSQGEIRLQGFAATATITNIAATSNAVFTGFLDSAYTSLVVLNITAGSTKSNPVSASTASYSAYKTGAGFTFRNLAPRTWALDGVQTFQIID